MSDRNGGIELSAPSGWPTAMVFIVALLCLTTCVVLQEGWLT